MNRTNRTSIHPLRVLGLLCAFVGSLVPAMGHATAPTGQFTDNADGTITDNRTGIIWQKAIAPGTYSQSGAVSYCAGVTIGGNSNWRLPEIAELQSTYDPCSSQRVDTTYFPGNPSTGGLWSNTVYALDANEAWSLSNNSFHEPKTNQRNVRCVR